MATHVPARRVVGVLTVAVIVLLSGCSAISSPGPAGPTGSSTAASPGPTSVATMAPTAPPDANSSRASQAAWLTLPSARRNPGALIVDTHADYQCPYCKEAENRYAPLLEELSDRGDVVWRIHFRSFLDGVSKANPASSTRAVMAATCVDVADPTKFAAYNNAIFFNQPQEGAGFTDQQLLTDFPAAAGLTGTALATFTSCYTSQATLAWVQAVEQNNKSATANASPPQTYLFGGNDPLCYVTSGGRTTPANCTDPGAVAAGVLGTPSFFVAGVQFKLSDLINNDWSPKYATADDLLTFLKGVAGA